MDENYILKEGCITSPMLDEHSTATIVEKTVNVSDIGEFVVGEMNSSVITFKMNRYYDGVDLSQKDILIMYKNTNGVYKDKAVNIQYSTDGLKFSWIVPNDATKTIKITAYVCFISDDYLWKTKNFTISFNPSFDVTDSEHTTNWFVSLESELIKINKKIDEIAEWARQPEKPTYTYEEVGAEKAGTSEKNLEKSKSYTDEEVRKVKEEVLPEKIKDVETFVSTQIQDTNKMYFIENRYGITFDEITSMLNNNKIPYFHDNGNVYIYYGRKDETYEFYSVLGGKIHKQVLSSDNNWEYDSFISFKPIKSNNLNDVGINGYRYLHSYDDLSDFNFPEKADKTKDSLLISYYDDSEGSQFLYNGSNVFVRYGYPEMGWIIYNDWIELTSSPTMYIHVTLEEKDGETVCKSDKTYEEIKEAVDSGKSPVAIYLDAAFFTLDTNMTGKGYIFTNSRLGVIVISHDNNNTVADCYGIPPYVTVTWSVNNMDIDVQITNDELTNSPTNINSYRLSCQNFGRNPAIKLCVRKTNGMDVSYDVLLYYTGNDFAGTTFINGNLTYCRLTMKDMSDTSTWDYTETEIPELYANMSRYVSTDNIAECNEVYKDENGTLYNERSVKYYDTMDKVCTNNTIYGNIAIVKSKGNSDIDIPYPVTVYSTSVNSHGNFDGWIVDACGNRYLCTIGGSKVTLGELMIHGIPQPSKNDANKVLYGDMTWKDAPNATDEHINTLIDKKLGVIENGTY